MAYFFTMPKLGMDMTKGQIIEWLVKEGDPVRVGDPVLEIETDKAANEIESPANGILARILYPKGETVPCNSVIAVILDAGEDMPASIPVMIGEEEVSRVDGASDKNVIEKETQPANTDLPGGKRLFVSPSAKKLAEELGVDLNSIIPDGAHINREDVQRAFEKQKAGLKRMDANIEKKPFKGIRKLTAELMSKSASTTARVALNVTVNAEELIATRGKSSSLAQKTSYNILLAKAVAGALKEFPYMNAQLVGDEIWENKEINIGIAVDSERGLFVPVLRNVDLKSIETLNNDFLMLVERVQSGRLNSADLEGGTFTITNLGSEQVESFIPIINYPECAILAVGSIMPEVVVENGEMVIRKMMALTLVFDHRLVDGMPAAKFLKRLKDIIENFEHE